MNWFSKRGIPERSVKFSLPYDNTPSEGKKSFGDRMQVRCILFVPHISLLTIF
jgi:hypothetical protein